MIVIGGGIVGLSTANQLGAAFPDLSITLVEKEDEVGRHQTGHNSGVIHAGVYYAPGSLKAQLCKAGATATYDYCRQHGIPVEQCGKLIVATDDVERARLETLYARCIENGLSPEKLDAGQLRRREPNITGLAAIFVAATGITDYGMIARTMAGEIEARGGTVLTGTRVLSMREEGDRVVVETTRGDLQSDFAVVCGGLHADRFARMCGIDLDFRIIPFRGEYYRLPESKNHVVRHLVYPVPDPALPFLGVHLTRMIGGYMTVGPNAVLALSREGYRWSDISLPDLAAMASFPGLWRVLKQHRRSAMAEFRSSVFRQHYLRQCQKYCPELVLEDLLPYPAGVRAQAVLRDGTLVHDFMMRNTRRTLHVCNAPSPAATSAIPIGRDIAAKSAALFGLQR